MAIKTCSICASPVREQIDRALREKQKLRDIERYSGFSRSALSRHARRHTSKAVVEASHSRHYKPGARILVRWPEMNFMGVAERARLEIFGGREITEAELRPDDDFVLGVVFETFVPRNLSAEARWREKLAEEVPQSNSEEKIAVAAQESQSEPSGEES